MLGVREPVRLQLPWFFVEGGRGGARRGCTSMSKSMERLVSSVHPGNGLCPQACSG